MHDIIFRKKIFWLTTTSVPGPCVAYLYDIWGSPSITSRRIIEVDRGCASGGHERVDHLTVPLLTPLVGILLEGHRGRQGVDLW